MYQMNYKLTQRLHNLVPHCYSLLLQVALEGKIINTLINYYDIDFANDVKWFTEHQFWDAFVDLYRRFDITKSACLYRLKNDVIAKHYPVEAVLLLIKRGYGDSQAIFTAAVEANNLPLVKAIHDGGFKTAKILPYDLPTDARLDYMERGLNLTHGDSLAQFLVSVGLLYEIPTCISYDPYDAFGGGPISSFDPSFDYIDDDHSTTFKDHIYAHEDFTSYY
ncbi:hypothetical protein D5b_00172 [Faustovirus]|nr:hypothetical protein D5b_00172 [Faustovirus]AMN84740.1 hypothetical protein D6_00339 [Faustovirus]AMP44128.1 hypothetical protein PRJ_Dakar_00170 [Faustovirus]QKE50425.1 hypothetical protein F-VV10_0305 [Faustovirus]